MSEPARVIIEHKDGRRYSVTEDGFRDLGYKAEGFKIVGPDGDQETAPEPVKIKRGAKSKLRKGVALKPGDVGELNEPGETVVHKAGSAEAEAFRAETSEPHDLAPLE